MLRSKSRLSHHITRMQRGLLDREERADDGLGSVIVLTEDGWQAIVEAAPRHVESVRRHLIDLLVEGEIDAMAALSHRVVERLTSLGAE